MHSLKRKKSEIWNFFSVEDDNKAKCNICKSIFSYKTSVTNLKSHILRKHPSIKFQQLERIQNVEESDVREREQPQTSEGSSGPSVIRDSHEDYWTSRNTDSVIAVTVHFIDKHFDVKSVLLDCAEYEGGYTSENLSQILRRIIADWNISENSILLAISDNASNIKKAISTDLKWRHFGCYGHIVNLKVSDSLNLIQDTLSKVSKIMSHFRKSANAKNKLDIVQQQQ
ncbi:hypothetical protein NQ314_008825, partial [Rhamnusium bicolor]